MLETLILPPFFVAIVTLSTLNHPRHRSLNPPLVVVALVLYCAFLFDYLDFFLQKISSMSKRKGKIIEIESDEEIDSYPFLLKETPLGPQIPSSDVDPYNSKNTMRQLQLEITLPPSGHEPNGGNDEQTSGSGESCSSSRAESLEEENDNEESSPEPSRPAKKKNLGHRVEAGSYPINFLRYSTTQNDLFKLRNLYCIPDDIHLIIPGKGDVPRRPPRGYVTLHLEWFKLGVRLPLQLYFAKVLSDLHLALGQLNPNGWRVLLGLFVLWDRCRVEEPTTEEIKNLY